MELPDGRPLVVHDSVLSESSEGRIILWVPGERAGGYREWERVLTAAHSPVVTGQGVSSIAASSVALRQRLGGTFGNLLRRLGGPRKDRDWTLPGGEPAEQHGARRTDLVLAWAVDEAGPLDEGRIVALWPERRESRAIGPNLYVVSGVEPGRPRAVAKMASELPREESARAIAERALDAARATGDRRGAVTALADLGVALLFEGDFPRAAAILERARAEARELGDPALEADASSNLALAVSHTGHLERAREILDPVLDHARAVGDRYAEKLALDRLARALAGLGDHAGALARFQEAATLAVEMDDRQHEADLLWRAAVELAELGRRDQAMASAGASVDRLRRLNNPKAAWYEQHLSNYRSGAAGAALASNAPPSSYLGGSMDTGVQATSPNPTVRSNGPGPLRMALTAAKAMATFIGSGFKTASPETYRARLATCASCKHHTGVRCRICGCITAAKARLLHERCPAGKWPA